MPSPSRALMSVIIGLVAAMVFGARTAGAQMETIAPVRVLDCSWTGDADLNDLNRAVRGRARAIGAAAAPTHVAAALVPVFRDHGLTDGVLWMGAWSDGRTMATDLSRAAAAGARVHEAFADDMRCDAAINFAKITIVGDPVTINGFVGREQSLLSVAECALLPGRQVPEAIAAIGQWAQYLLDHDAQTSQAMLFPTAGERSARHYNFKWAVGYESYAAYGRDFDHFGRGGGLRVYDELFETLLSCDSPQIYEVIEFE